MPEFVCSTCFKEGTIVQGVTLHGCWEAVEVYLDPEHPDRFQTRTTGERGVSWDSTDAEDFYCTHCETVRPRLEELVTAKPYFECRTCGFRGAVPDQHPERCPDEPERIDPPAVAAGQERLVA
jgi:DNA-directed RNA polymerase subunit RPC12/RpoP